jgi:hypothetical protein
VDRERERDARRHARAAMCGLARRNSISSPP